MSALPGDRRMEESRGGGGGDILTTLKTEKSVSIKGRIQLAAHRKFRCSFLSSIRIGPLSFTSSSNINAAEVQILQRAACSKVESRNTRRHIGRSTSRSVYYYVGNSWKKERQDAQSYPDQSFFKT